MNLWYWFDGGAYKVNVYNNNCQNIQEKSQANTTPKQKREGKLFTRAKFSRLQQ